MNQLFGLQHRSRTDPVIYSYNFFMTIFFFSTVMFVECKDIDIF